MRDERTVIQHKHERAMTYQMIRTCLVYLFLIGLWVFVVNIYSVFGVKWIQFAVPLMWISGAVACFGIPDEQESTLKETKWAIGGYLGFLLIYRIAIVKFSGISPSEVGASLGVNVPVSSAAATAGFLQNILMITSVMVPIGFVFWVGNKFKVYSGGKRKEEAFMQYKGQRRR